MNDNGRKIFASFLIILFYISLIYPAHAAATKEGSLEKRIKSFRLANGIRVLILERSFSPTASFYIRFRIGAVDENDGKTGIAHLLEHMMFKGTKTIGAKDIRKEKEILAKIKKTGAALDYARSQGERKNREHIAKLSSELAALQKLQKRWYRSNEINRLYTEAGGVNINASTGQDMITYHVSLPANKAELWARIESDRIRNPVWREFYTERSVVRQERSQRYEADPDGFLYERFAAAAFMVHPYRRPIIGWQSDIDYLNIDDLEEFHGRAKTPQNIVIAVVGDVRTEEIRRLIIRYFGSLPPGRHTPPILAMEPPQRGEKRLTLRFDASDRLIIGYHKPPPPEKDDYVFDIIEAILSRGRSSRFYRRIIEEQGLAENIQAVNGLPGARYPNLFCIFASVRKPSGIDKLAAAIDDMIHKLTNELISDEELKKVKNQLSADFMRRQDSNEGLAGQLSYYEALLGNYRYIDNYYKNIDAITAEEIRNAAGRFLTKDNRTLAIMTKN